MHVYNIFGGMDAGIDGWREGMKACLYARVLITCEDVTLPCSVEAYLADSLSQLPRASRRS